MLFIIERTTLSCNNVQSPYEGAKLIEVPQYDIRGWTEEQFNKHSDTPWKYVGSDHIILPNGNIRRTTGTIKVWTLEVSTLEELMFLMETVKEDLVISAKSDDRDFPTIEIYDDYRE